MWLSSRHPRRSCSSRPSYRPRLEKLEERCLPSSGPLDPTFGSGGIVTSQISTKGGSQTHAVALQADGKILAAGSADGNNGSLFALARYTTGGTLDSTFGSGGKVTTKFGKGT